MIDVMLELRRKDMGYEAILRGEDYSIGDILRHELVKMGLYSGLIQPHPLVREHVIYIGSDKGPEALKSAVEEALRVVGELKREAARVKGQE